MSPAGPARSAVSTSHALYSPSARSTAAAKAESGASLCLGNDSSSIDFAIDPGATTLTAGGVSYRVVAGATAVANVAAGGRLDDWFEFAIPDHVDGPAVLHFGWEPGGPAISGAVAILAGPAEALNTIARGDLRHRPERGDAHVDARIHSQTTVATLMRSTEAPAEFNGRDGVVKDRESGENPLLAVARTPGRLDR